jgi:hypothetical protein
MTDRILRVSRELEGKWEHNKTLHKLFIDYEKTYDSVRREVMYNILIEFGITTNPVTLIKICLNETYSKVRKSKSVWYISYSMV